MSNNKPIPKKTLKYLFYIYDILFSRTLSPPFTSIGFKDGPNSKDLQAVYKLNYQRFLESMKAQGILALAEKSYSKAKCDTYSIDVNRYLEVLHSIFASEKVPEYLLEDDFSFLVNPGTITCPNKDGSSFSIPCPMPRANFDITSYIFLIRRLYNRSIKANDPSIWKSAFRKIRVLEQKIEWYMTTGGYSNFIRESEGNLEYRKKIITDNGKEIDFPDPDKEIVEAIAQWNLETLQNLYFPAPKLLTYSEMTCVKEYIKKQLSEKSRILNTLQTEMGILQQRTTSENPVARVRINFDYLKTKKQYRVKVSTRQYNDFCRTPKVERPNLLAEAGLDGNLDLHSAIFAMSRLMNNGEFDVDWDIKALFMNEQVTDVNGELLTRDNYKALGMRLFFKASEGKAYANYCHALHERSEKIKKHIPIKANDPDLNLPKISKETFHTLMDKVEELVGRTDQFTKNIFVIESIFELKVMNHLLDKGIRYKNCFDCFYFDTSEISESEMRALVCEVADETAMQLSYLFADNR